LAPHIMHSNVKTEVSCVLGSEFDRKNLVKRRIEKSDV
jgi:hypothetical protein